MTRATTDVRMTEHDPAVSRLAHRISSRCGIDYSGSLYSLASKVSTRLQALNMTVGEYLAYLERNEAEWDALIESVTVNETYFMREEHQLQELVNHVLPALQHQDEIRIWSAACSTGEEPYSLAMVIRESGVVPLSKIRIYATDLNRKVLHTAEQGFYSKHSMCFRRTPEHIKQTYFDEEEDGYRIKREIRNVVRFSPWNLLRPADGVLPVMDIIFCRNVLIYFDEATIRTVLSHLSNRLAEGGYLFLGHAETASGLLPELQVVHTPTAFYYRKNGGCA